MSLLTQIIALLAAFAIWGSFFWMMSGGIILVEKAYKSLRAKFLVIIDRKKP